MINTLLGLTKQDQATLRCIYRTMTSEYFNRGFPQYKTVHSYLNERALPVDQVEIKPMSEML